MTLQTIVEKLGLEVRSPSTRLGATVTGGYVSDLLSDVLAHASEGNLWITLQIHPNIVAIASIKGLAGIVLTNGRTPEEETIRKAGEEDLPILISAMSTFELTGKLYSLIAGGMTDDAKGI